jgi:hypothetical protein
MLWMRKKRSSAMLSPPDRTTTVFHASQLKTPAKKRVHYADASTPGAESLPTETPPNKMRAPTPAGPQSVPLLVLIAVRSRTFRSVNSSVLTTTNCSSFSSSSGLTPQLRYRLIVQDTVAPDSPSRLALHPPPRLYKTLKCLTATTTRRK